MSQHILSAVFGVWFKLWHVPQSCALNSWADRHGRLWIACVHEQLIRRGSALALNSALAGALQFEATSSEVCAKIGKARPCMRCLYQRQEAVLA